MYQQYTAHPYVPGYLSLLYVVELVGLGLWPLTVIALRQFEGERLESPLEL